MSEFISTYIIQSFLFLSSETVLVKSVYVPDIFREVMYEFLYRLSSYVYISDREMFLKRFPLYGGNVLHILNRIMIVFILTYSGKSDILTARKNLNTLVNTCSLLPNYYTNIPIF